MENNQNVKGTIISLERYEYNDNDAVISVKINDKESINKYDERGNLIYEKDINGNVITHEYNENNMLLRSKDSDGNIIFEYEYDNDNNIISYKSKAYGYITRYDEHHNLIYKSSNGIKSSYAYNNKSICTCDVEECKDRRIVSLYSDDGNIISETTIFKDGDISVKKYEYNENNKLLKVIEDGDVITLCEYDSNGNLIHYKSLNNEYTNEFDSNNNLIRYTNYVIDITESYEYDENNNMIKSHNSNGDVSSYKYDKNNNVIYENRNGCISTYEYDENNIQIHSKSNMVESFYIVDPETNDRLLSRQIDAVMKTETILTYDDKYRLIERKVLSI